MEKVFVVFVSTYSDGQEVLGVARDLETAQAIANFVHGSALPWDEDGDVMLEDDDDTRYWYLQLPVQ